MHEQDHGDRATLSSISSLNTDFKTPIGSIIKEKDTHLIKKQTRSKHKHSANPEMLQRTQEKENGIRT